MPLIRPKESRKIISHIHRNALDKLVGTGCIKRYRMEGLPYYYQYEGEDVIKLHSKE